MGVKRTPFLCIFASRVIPQLSGLVSTSERSRLIQKKRMTAIEVLNTRIACPASTM
jgi:hypothetical protein